MGKTSMSFVGWVVIHLEEFGCDGVDSFALGQV
jgi:hypothetical protein